ncbi:phytase [Erythrobacter sp. 3-20A1M]|uniref:phytase n=1 Tax=Erythrobacter sp. 3-20A1M TaxID=2653850 RepID=UPI001BFC5BA7|nr:phytase [Erythrobacter sp. 3-20A1M]QWC56776.1 phytase [Erythrobacter sp. 3-20A1M]
MRKAIYLAAAGAFALAGCATNPVTGDPAVTVQAIGETEPVGTADEDAADDPAIWRNPADPAASLIVATDKKAGLYVYDLDGKRRSFTDAGRVNNVDVVDMGEVAGIVVVASDRTDPANAVFRMWRLDPATAALTPIGSSAVGAGEAYGICAMRAGDRLRVASIIKDGRIVERETGFLKGNIAPIGTQSIDRKVPTQAEGCVYDPRDGALYVGEENAGIWRFDRGAREGTLVAPADNRMLVADVEGLAMIPEGEDGGWLVASSQGDNAYAVFALPGMEPVGRFRIGAGAFGSTEETDGIGLMPGSFGAKYPDGLFVAQDGDNAPAAQNFKLVRWDAIRAALGID